MIQLNNAMEIFKILPKTNCRDCRVPTCFAFAAAAFKGEKRLGDCLHLDKATLETFSVQNSDSRTLEREQEQALESVETENCRRGSEFCRREIAGFVFRRKTNGQVPWQGFPS